MQTKICFCLFVLAALIGGIQTAPAGLLEEGSSAYVINDNTPPLTSELGVPLGALGKGFVGTD
ncbi:hypothetical protein MBANPS3_007543 [Mucor bainieri]